MNSNAARDKVMQDEAQALAELLSTHDRCVMVIVMVADSDDDGAVYVTHGVAGDTRGAHLRQFIAGIERKLSWLRDRLYRKV
jgi:hypothetical protein